MPISLTVARGHTFTEGVPFTSDDLNAAALPAVSLEGGVTAADIGDGEITASLITPGAIASVASTGSSNAYVAAPSPALAGLATGVWIFVKANHTNTGAATINVNGLGAKAIKKWASGAVADVQAGDIQSGQEMLLAYDGTQWQLIGDVYASKWNYALATGAANTYAIAVREQLGYADIVGLPIVFKTNAANSGACTLNLNGLGAKSIKKADGTDPFSGQLANGALVAVAYDGTNFQLLGDMPLQAVASAATTAYPADITVDVNGRVTGVTAGARYTTTAGSYQSIPAAGAKVEFTHSLGAVPFMFDIVLICTDAGGDVGYSENDEVRASAAWESVGDEEIHLDAMYKTGTVIGIVRYSDMTGMSLPHKSTGVRTAITTSKWKLKGYAAK